jgi:hypothetical protein
MSETIVKSNGHRRPLVSLYQSLDVPESQFDYITIWQDGHKNKSVSPITGDVKCECGAFYCEEYADEVYETRFFEYRGSWYDVQEFTRIVVADTPQPGFAITVPADSPIAKWQGCQTESAWSAVLVRYPEDDYGVDTESIVVGYSHW